MKCKFFSFWWESNNVVQTVKWLESLLQITKNKIKLCYQLGNVQKFENLGSRQKVEGEFRGEKFPLSGHSTVKNFNSMNNSNNTKMTVQSICNEK